MSKVLLESWKEYKGVHQHNNGVKWDYSSKVDNVLWECRGAKGYLWFEDQEIFLGEMAIVLDLPPS